MQSVAVILEGEYSPVEFVPDDLRDAASAQIAFGPFRVDAGKRLLTRDGAPVDIGGRALDLLIALAERPGRVLSKRELLKRVWPDIVVEEGSLRFHMAGLRRLLGDGENGARYISTQVGVGYAFVAPIEKLRRADEPYPMPAEIGWSEDLSPIDPAGRLPPRARLIGRDADVRLILDRLIEPKLFTIVGGGGVGKTSLAIEVGHRLSGDRNVHVRFVDLAQVESAAVVPSALASALGIPVQAEDQMLVLLAHIRTQKLLLVIDNCEHLIDAVCAVVEQIRDGAPAVGVLATSREPLRARNEHVHWLNPLEFPSSTHDLPSDALFAFPAVELFAERASAGNAALQLGAEDGRLIADMCRRLEGMALPIELAALRAAAHGVAATHALLGERFSLEWAGRRTAQPRQQTLRATLDWSYGLLSATEQLAFDRLSVFVGPFSLDAAVRIAADTQIDPAAAGAALAALVEKGLVAIDRSAGASSHRLLEMTRAYAKEKLLARGDAEVHGAALRHAEFYLSSLEHLGTSAEDIFEGSARFANQLGNVRSALEWSFGPDGDPSIAIPLAAASAPLFLHLSLLVECRNWCTRATGMLDRDLSGTVTEMELQAALGLVLMFTRGNTAAAEIALRRALDIAVALGDGWNQLRILGRLHIFYERIGDFATAMAWAKQAVEVGNAIGEPEAIAVAASLAGISLHLLGEQARARRELEKSLRNSLPSERSRTTYYGFDHRNRSAIALARTLWLQGFADQARQWAEQAVAEAAALDHSVTHCIALIWALSVYLWAGDMDQAETSLRTFTDRAEANALGPYIAASRGFQGTIAIQQGKPQEATGLIEESLARLHAMRYELLTTSFEISLAEGLILSGAYAEAGERVEATIERCRKSGDAFALPELLRIKARTLGSTGDATTETVEAVLDESLALAKRQGARAWELRAAIDLAQLQWEQGRRFDAQQLLQPYRDGMAEGRDTQDRRGLDLLWQKIQPVCAG